MPRPTENLIRRELNFFHCINSESETREVKSLDDIWNFAQSNLSDPLRGFTSKWFMKDLSKVLLSSGLCSIDEFIFKQINIDST